MEDKMEMMLNNQAKMLEHLVILTRDVNELKVGQKKLEKGQERLEVRVTSLEEGQKKLIGRVTSLEEGQKKLIGRVTSLEKGQKELKKGQEYLKKKVDVIVEEQETTNDEFKWLHKDYLKTKNKVDKLEKISKREEMQIA